MSRAVANAARVGIKASKEKISSIVDEARRGGAALAQALPKQEVVQSQPPLTMTTPAQQDAGKFEGPKKIRFGYETTKGFMRVKVEEVKEDKTRINDWEKMFH